MPRKIAVEDPSLTKQEIAAIKNRERLERAIRRAIEEIADPKSWARCDEETGEECPGLKCKLGEHRAVVILENALRS